MAEADVAGLAGRGSFRAAGGSRNSPFLDRILRLRYVVVALALPLVILVVGAARHRWYPTGDLAHTELMLRSIPRHPPLIGVAARVGTLEDPGSAPGPSMAYAMYPVYLLLGRSALAMVVAVNLLHLLGAALATAVAWRRHGRLAGLSVAVACAVMFRGLMPDFFLEPWNVWIPVLAFFAYLIVLWGIVQRRTAGLPVAVALGAHCAQTHISYVPLIGGTLGLAIVWLFANRRRLDGRLGRDIGLAALVGAASLALPVAEQLGAGTGNLGRLWRHFTDPPEQPIALGSAIQGFFGEYNLFGPWIVGPGHQPTDPVNWIGAAAMVAVVGSGLVVAWRRRDRLTLDLYAVVLAVTALGLFSVTRIFGEFYDYLLRWIWPINALSIAAAILAWVRAATAAEGDASAAISATNHPSTPGPSSASVGPVGPSTADTPSARRARRTTLGLGGAIALLLAATSAQAIGAEPQDASDSKLVGGLAGQLAPQLSTDAAYLLRWHDPAALGGSAYGLLLEMERQGYHLGVDSWGRAAAQPHRVQAEDSAASVLWLVTGEVSIARFAAIDGAVKLAEFDARTPADQRRSAELRSAIEARLAAIGRPELVARLDEQYGTTQLLFFEELPDDIDEMVGEFHDLRSAGAVFEVPRLWGLFPR